MSDKLLYRAEKLYTLAFRVDTPEQEAAAAKNRLESLLNKMGMSMEEFLSIKKQDFILSFGDVYELQLFRTIITIKHLDEKMDVDGKIVSDTQIIMTANKQDMESVDNYYRKLLEKYRYARDKVKEEAEVPKVQTMSTNIIFRNGGAIYMQSTSTNSYGWGHQPFEFDEDLFLTTFIAKYQLIPKNLDRSQAQNTMTAEQIAKMKKMFNMFTKENLYDQID